MKKLLVALLCLALMVVPVAVATQTGQETAKIVLGSLSASFEGAIIYNVYFTVSGMDGAAAQLYFGYRTDDLMNKCTPPNGHIYEGVWMVGTPATLEQEGLEYRVCTECGKGKESRGIPKRIDTIDDTFRTDTAVSAVLVPDLYGGLGIKSGFLTDNYRTRLVIGDHLQVGDIIFAEYSGGRIAMVYVGNGQLVVADSISGTCTLQTITGDEFSSDNILVTLLAYDRYAFLRPAMV